MTREMFDIPSHNYAFLEKKVEKLNKAAAKLGCDPIEYGIVYSFAKEVEFKSNIVNIEFYKVYVTGSAPSLSGWSFIGKREPLEDGSAIVKSFIADSIPTELMDGHAIKCDHCKKNARRSFSYLVKNESNQFMEVGKSCLKDFIGHASPEKYATFAESLANIAEEFSGIDYQGSGSNAIPVVGLADVFAASAAAIMTYGYVSNTTSKESMGEKCATSSHVSELFFGKYSTLSTLAKHYDMVHGCVEYVKSLPDNSAFNITLKQIIKQNYVSARVFGYCASAMSSYIRSLTPKADVSSVVNAAIGNVDDKVVFDAVIMSLSRFESQSGFLTSAITMQTTTNHIVKMFTTSDTSDLGKGDSIRVSGKVGKVGVETYERSPYKGIVVTQMAHRSRILDAQPA